MPLQDGVQLNVGDVVAIHGTVEFVSPSKPGEDSPDIYKVQLPGVAPIHFRADQIGSVVSRRLEQGDYVAIKNGQYAGLVALVIGSSGEWAFVQISKQEMPIVVSVADVMPYRYIPAYKPRHGDGAEGC